MLLIPCAGRGAKPCTYRYPFKTVREFVDFCQKVRITFIDTSPSPLIINQLTRWGESGVYGFLEHLNSRAAATLLLDSITTEARQQLIFRQFEGLFPMDVSVLPHPRPLYYAKLLYLDLVCAGHPTVNGVDSLTTLYCHLSS